MPHGVLAPELDSATRASAPQPPLSRTGPSLCLEQRPKRGRGGTRQGRLARRGLMLRRRGFALRQRRVRREREAWGTRTRLSPDTGGDDETGKTWNSDRNPASAASRSPAGSSIIAVLQAPDGEDAGPTCGEWGTCGTRFATARANSSWRNLGRQTARHRCGAAESDPHGTTRFRRATPRVRDCCSFPLPYIPFNGGGEHACWTMVVWIERGAYGTVAGHLRDPSGRVAGPKREEKGTDRGTRGTLVGKLGYSPSPPITASGERRWTLPRSWW